MKTVIITGANSGLGYQCAKTIAQAGQDWMVVLACRSIAKGEQARGQLLKETDYPHLVVRELDLASLDSIRTFASAFGQAGLPPLQGLINNAGLQVMQGLHYTKDGFELTFGTNHLGHFLLTNLLLSQLVTPARIVVVSSGTHDPATLEGKYNQPVWLGAKKLAHPQRTKEMSGLQRYATSKLCNVLFAYELDRKLRVSGRKGITVNAFDPAAVPATNLLGSIKNPLLRGLLKVSTRLFSVLGVYVSTPEKSGAAMARLLLDETLTGVSGKYFQVEQEKKSSQQSYQEDLGQQLWEDSLELTGLLEQRAHGSKLP
jgi:light-dependent protochlorophyllide reductase